MVSGAASLIGVRHQLFAVLDEADASLGRFLAEPGNDSLQHNAAEKLQQVRGILKYVELTGAELLAQEIAHQLGNVSAGPAVRQDKLLVALSDALLVLRYYLEGVDVHRQEMPELLLPAINDIRQSSQQPLLPESFFFSVRLEQKRLGAISLNLSDEVKQREGRRLRLSYQLGLLGFIREQDVCANLTLMGRAMGRLDRLFAGPNTLLFWLAGAALEAYVDGHLLPRKARKQLFSRIDAELRQILSTPQHEPPRSLLKELLYLIALSDGQGALTQEVRAQFGIIPLPFTDHLLEEEFQRISGAGREMIRSRCAAIRTELDIVKDLLDQVARGALLNEDLVRLHALLAKVGKALAMVGLGFAGNTLTAQLPAVLSWCQGTRPQQNDLFKLANEVLYVLGELSLLERDERARLSRVESDTSLFAQQQLVEARIVVLGESRAGLSLARQAIVDYLNSTDDRMQMTDLPYSLKSVGAALWFLDLEPVANLVEACGSYIRSSILDAEQAPSKQQLELLDNALSRLECYLAADSVLAESDMLDRAVKDIKQLGVHVAA